MTFEKILVVLVLAAVIVGPHRLPLLAQRLAVLVRAVRAVTDGARAQVEREVGVSLAVAEWRALDPRQYDPRRIVREALSATPAAVEGSAGAAAREVAEARDAANRLAATRPGGWRPAVASPVDVAPVVAAPIAEGSAQPYLSPTGISAVTVSPGGASGQVHAGS